jgi:hypothetical protein
MTLAVRHSLAEETMGAFARIVATDRQPMYRDQ